MFELISSIPKQSDHNLYTSIGRMKAMPMPDHAPFEKERGIQNFPLVSPPSKEIIPYTKSDARTKFDTSERGEGMKIDKKSLELTPESSREFIWMLQTCRLYEANERYEEWYWNATPEQRDSALRSCQQYMRYDPLFRAYLIHMRALRRKKKKWLAISIGETILIIVLLAYISILS